MGNWYGHARTNYFRVKDVAAFKEEFGKLEVEIIEPSNPDWPGDGRGAGMVGLIGEDEYGSFPWHRYDEEADEDIEFDVAELVAKHLADGEVAVFMEVGAEKMRYLTGRAWAVNSRGERRDVSIDDIYKSAKDLGSNVTSATY